MMDNKTPRGDIDAHSQQQESHNTTGRWGGWAHQRGARGDLRTSESITIENVVVDGDRKDDDRRDYRTTKRLLSRVALAFIGTFATCFLVEKVLDISGPASALTNLTIHTAADTGHASTAWRSSVAECTGPEDGYVYGGDPGRVLSFVRSRREFSGGTVGGSVDYPSLSDVIRWVWTSKRDRGVLAFKVGELKRRRDKGVETGWECIFAANFGRNRTFPKGGPAESPWDPDAFNFYKANPHEFVLSYTPSFRYERQEGSAAAPPSLTSSEVEGRGLVAKAEVAKPDSLGSEGGVLRGAGGNVASESRAVSRAGSDSASSISCQEVSTESPPQDAVLVNIRPVGLVSLLLTPGYPYSNNQRATAYALAVAMDFAEALRNEPGFRLGFNSGGSSASVNHLHFQCWYFDASETRGLAIETAQTQFVAALPLAVDRPAADGEAAKDMVDVYALEGFPLRGLVFHTLGKDLEEVSKVIEKCVTFLVEVDTPHTMLFSTGRAFLLPRQPLEEPPFAVVPGFPEVSGEILVTTEEDFPKLKADQIFRWWRDHVSVDAEDFDRIVNTCIE